MKLINVKVENFGKLSNVNFDFSESCQVFCKHNGWGKSTLAAFLCVMFYGFGGEKKRDELANERKRYEPWQKGVYGGTVTFAVGEKKYCMSRVFGKKEAQDEFSLRLVDSNLESKDYSSNIGEELFQIDRESFRRTIFLSQHDCETYATDAINAKVGNLINHTDDVNNFASAFSRLKDATNSMRPNHKKGSLKQLKEEMGVLENKIRNEEILAKRMEETASLQSEQIEKCRHLQKQIGFLEKRQEALSGDLDLQSKRTEYNALCSAWKEEKEARDEVVGRFVDADCIPTVEEIESWQEQEKRCRELAVYVKQNTLSKQDGETYDSILKKWGNELPSDEQIEEMESANRSLIKLRRELSPYRLSLEEKKEKRKLEEKYAGNVPELSAIKALQGEFEKACYIKEGLATKKAAVETLTHVSKTNQPVMLLCAIGVLFVLLGAVGVFWQGLMGAVLMLIGLLCFGVGVFLKKKNATSKVENDEWQALEEQIKADCDFVNTTYDKVSDFLLVNRDDFETGELRNRLEEVVNDSQRYQLLFCKTHNEEIRKQEECAEQLFISIQMFLKKYVDEVQPEENWAMQLAEIRMTSASMRQWHKKKEDYVRASTAYREQNAELQQYLHSLGYTGEVDGEEVLQQLHINVRDYMVVVIRYQKALERKRDFEAKHDMEKILCDDEQGENESLGELTEQIHIAREKQKETEELIRDYENRLVEDQEQWDSIQEIKVELAEMQERYAEGLHKYQLLCKTMELLQTAKDSLVARYLEPVKKGFDKYYRMMTKREADVFQFDAGVKLTVTENGLQRDTKFLSEGCRDLVGICTRLALVDAMYQGEKPFLILDDPFADLDRETMKGALEFLKRVSEEYQIVYFTCHDSRVPLA